MTKTLEKTLLNLANSSTTAEALNKFEEALIANNYSQTSIGIVLEDLVFTHGHMARLKSLADSHDVKIDILYTGAVQTQLAALKVGLVVSEKAPGDEILENFKNSFNNTPQTDVTGTSELEDFYAQDTSENDETSIIDEITQEANNNTEQTEEFGLELKCLNDVVEIPNLEEEMVQQKIDLPFENKNDISEKLAEKRESNKEGSTLYLHQTLRSGQIISFEGNIVIAGDTHPGSEVIAGGDIIVWGTLGGIAHAGSKGNYKSSIRALKLNAIQLRIADYIARRPDITTDFTKELVIKPEVARIANGEISIFSLK